MTSPAARRPVARALAGAVLLAALLAPASAHADAAYEKVAQVYATSGGQLNPCAFTQAELEAAIRGIPPQIRSVVPDLRRAMQDGVATHERGDCEGVSAEQGSGGAAAPGSTVPPATTPPVTTPPVTTPQTATAPAVPTPTTTTPAPTPQPAADTSGDRDLTPLLVALVVAGTLLLLALLLWSWARMRGWDPLWVARARHAWGEAGFRTTTTWAEFADWLRLGR